MGRTRWLRVVVAVLFVSAASAGGCGEEPDRPATANESTAPPSAERKDILGTEKKLYSQLDEELIIRDFFQDRKGGFFVDVGCAFPIRSSTTYYLEKHLGWRGIGVDALPDYAAMWARIRPRSTYLQYLVGERSGTHEKFYRAGAPGLSSVEKGRVFLGKAVRQEEITVPTITLDDLLDQQGVEKIDLLSIDIEESEPAALRGFDIERFEPELVCVEASPSIRPFLRQYFARHGYERIDAYLKRDYSNWYYTRKAPE